MGKSPHCRATQWPVFAGHFHNVLVVGSIMVINEVVERLAKPVKPLSGPCTRHAPVVLRTAANQGE